MVNSRKRERAIFCKFVPAQSKFKNRDSDKVNFIKYLLLLLTIMILPLTGNAQVLNVESFRGAGSDETGWKGQTAFDISLSKYRDSVFKLGNETNAAYFSEKHAYLFLTSVEFISLDGSSVISNGFFHLRSTFFNRKNWSPELFAQYQYNENLGMVGRMVGGSTVRHTFLERENLRGSFTTGFMYEIEEWRDADDSIIENRLFKSTSNLVLRGALSENANLMVIGYYQARPDRFFSPRLISENRLTFNITGSVSYRASFVLSYDTEPVIDIPELTYELKNGIIIRL